MQFDRIHWTESKEMLDIEAFLERNDLFLDPQVETFIAAYNDNGRIIACGGLAGDIIKCVAIDRGMRDSGMLLQLISQLVNLAYEVNRTNLFIYTKPEYEALFRFCGFYTIAMASPHVVLLENSKTRLDKWCDKLSAKKIAGEKIGSIVMNANPFTLGHRYLIEQALSQCDHLHLFIVGEDSSQFSYQDRLNLVAQGIKDLKNITLHEGSDYIISRATFPNYFLKDEKLRDRCYFEIDLKLFREHIAAALNITHRFVGSEPLCPITSEYNKSMHYWLNNAEMDAPEIAVVELDRTGYNDQPISASTVRSLLSEKNWEALEHFVPKTTFNFLQEHYS